MLCDFIIRLHLCFVIGDLRVHFTLGIINNLGSLDNCICDQCFGSDHNIVLLLLLGNSLLHRDVSSLKSVFEFLRQIGLCQLQSLHSREALPLEDFIERTLHISLNGRQRFEEFRRREVGCLIIHNVYGESNARRLVVLAVSSVESCEVFLVQLILEVSPEGDHKSILGPGLN